MIALIIYVRITSHSNYSETRWLKRKKKKKDNHFIIGSRFSGSRTWARLSWVHLLLHMAATEITQWNSVGGRAGQGDQMASLPGLAPRGHGWKAGHSWPEEVSHDPSSTMVSGLSDFLRRLRVLRGFTEPGSISLWFLSNITSPLFCWSQSLLRGKGFRHKPHLLVGGPPKNSQTPLTLQIEKDCQAKWLTFFPLNYLCFSVMFPHQYLQSLA